MLSGHLMFEGQQVTLSHIWRHVLNNADYDRKLHLVYETK